MPAAIVASIQVGKFRLRRPIGWTAGRPGVGKEQIERGGRRRGTLTAPHPVVWGRVHQVKWAAARGPGKHVGRWRQRRVVTAVHQVVRRRRQAAARRQEVGIAVHLKLERKEVKLKTRFSHILPGPHLLVKAKIVGFKRRGWGGGRRRHGSKSCFLSFFYLRLSCCMQLKRTTSSGPFAIPITR